MGETLQKRREPQRRGLQVLRVLHCSPQVEFGSTTKDQEEHRRSGQADQPGLTKYTFITLTTSF